MKHKDNPTREKGLIYVIQEHHATRLHWDLRLEKEGVLKSWAIPKSPPLQVGIKRLAVSVEDHALDYAEFEGRIPEGLYGAGEVNIWDKGYYTPLEIKENKMVFEINGKRLNGIYCLIKLKPDIKSDKNWLFFKKKA